MISYITGKIVRKLLRTSPDKAPASLVVASLGSRIIGQRQRIRIIMKIPEVTQEYKLKIFVANY